MKDLSTYISEGFFNNVGADNIVNEYIKQYILKKFGKPDYVVDADNSRSYISLTYKNIKNNQIVKAFESVSCDEDFIKFFKYRFNDLFTWMIKNKMIYQYSSLSDMYSMTFCDRNLKKAVKFRFQENKKHDYRDMLQIFIYNINSVEDFK